jgi:hypothetical protein
VIGFVLVFDAENRKELGEHAVRFVNLDENIVVAWASMKIWVGLKNVGSCFTCVKDSVVADLEVLMHHDLEFKLIESGLGQLLIELVHDHWNQRQHDG